MTEITIALSKRKMIYGLLACFALVSTSSWLIYLAITAKHSWPELFTSVVIGAIGIIGIALFGGIAIAIFSRLFNRKPGLMINDQGISDNTSSLSVGLIAWQDILTLQTVVISSTKLLMIVVRNPEDYLNKSTSKLKTRLMRSNLKMYGSPIAISATNLQCNYDELELTVINAFNEYLANSQNHNATAQ